MIKLNVAPMRPLRMSLIGSVVAAYMASSINPSLAQENVLLYNAWGQPTFEISFFTNGDTYRRYYDSPEGFVNFTEFHTNNDITDAEKQMVLEGFGYWAELIEAQNPINIAIAAKQGVVDGVQQEENSAFGTPFFNQQAQFYAELVANGADLPFIAGVYTINPWTRYSYDGHLPYYPLTLLAQKTFEPQMATVALHESAHCLGMVAIFIKSFLGNRVLSPNSPPFELSFDLKQNKYDANIYDVNGTNFADAGYFKVVNTLDDARRYSQGYNEPVFVILSDLIEENPVNKDKVVFESGMYFKAPHVSEVLDGALLEHAHGQNNLQLPGIPLQGIECMADNPNAPCSFMPEASHLELNNSLLSHQSFRNWTTLMELEMAMFQDLGYEIDRKRYFGRSIYNSGANDTQRLSIVNTNPYYARNSSGTAYLTGTPSSQAYGIGLHVYGSFLDVTQRSEMLSNAPQSAGIRLEGRNNQLYIDKLTYIAFNGDGSYGLLVDFGQHHKIEHQGSIEALGQFGIAAAFDFGGNILGFGSEQNPLIGSTFWMTVSESSTQYEFLDTKKWLDGPLVDSFDVHGVLKGNAASIFIDYTALVKEINIYDDATVEGDIISYWDPSLKKFRNYGKVVELGNYKSDIRTQLNLLEDSTSASSPNEHSLAPQLTLRSNIIGADGLKLVNKTTAAVTGYGQLYSVTNDGSLLFYSKDAKGYNLQVTENISMQLNSYWGLTFNSDGISSRFKAAQVDLAGNVLLSPERAYYPSGKSIKLKIDPESIFSTNNLNGAWSLTQTQIWDNNSNLSFSFTANPASLESSTSAAASKAFTDPSTLWVQAYRFPQTYTAQAWDQSSTDFAYALLAEGEQSTTEHGDLIANFDFATDSYEFGSALQGLNASSYDAANYTQLSSLNLLSTTLSDMQYQKLYSNQRGSDLALNVLYHSHSYGDGQTNVDSDLAAALISLSLGKQSNWQYGLNFGVANLDSEISLEHNKVRNDSFDSDSLTLGAFASYVTDPHIKVSSFESELDSASGSTSAQSSYYALFSANYHYLDEKMERNVSAFGDTYRFINDFNGHAFTASATLGYNYTSRTQLPIDVAEPSNAVEGSTSDDKAAVDNLESADQKVLAETASALAFRQWSVGPFVSLDLAAIYQQDESEIDELQSGGALQLQDNQEYSLPLSLGLRGDYVLGWQDGSTMSFNARAAISHELLSDHFDTEYQLRHGNKQVSTSSSFDQDTTFILNAGMSWQLANGLHFKAGLQCEFADAEESVGGYLQAGYLF